MADSPIITCPECKKKFKGKGNLEGKKIKCPFCAEPFVVPVTMSVQDKIAADKAAVAGGAAPGAPAEQPRKRIVFEDEDDNPNPYGVTELDIAPRCPNCTQKMASPEAFICLNCGYNTLTREIGKTEKSISHTSGEIFSHLLPAFIVVGIIFLLILLHGFYSLVLPGLITGDARWLVHESLRFWLCLIVLGLTWPLGSFAYKRIVVNTSPPEKKIE